MTLSLTALPLRISARVTNPILLNDHKGSAIRGALFHALRKRSCARLELESCHPCELVPACPISALVATVDPEWDRGADPPRPFVVDPPLDPRTEYRAGDCIEFGLTLFGSAGRLLPYLILAIGDAGKVGLGRRYQRDGLWTMGRFDVERIELASPFSERSEVLYSAGQVQAGFRSPRRPLTGAEVEEALDSRLETVTLDFLTPTRLISRGERVPTFDLLAFLQRLRERLEALERRYGQATPSRVFDAAAIAAELRVTADSTRWCDVRSFSRRQKQAIPVGGFVGSVTITGNLAPVLAFLAWGQLTHVGKDATKGNGVYRLDPIC